MPGFRPPAGSHRSLNRPKRPTSLVAVHLRQQLRARLPVAVLAGERAAVRDDEVRQLLGEAPEAPRRPPSLIRSKSMRTWMQPSPKCPYGVPRSPCSAQQRAEVPQIRAEPGGRHRAVLPAGPRLAAVGASGSPCRRRPRGSATGPAAGRVGDDRCVAARPPRPHGTVRRRGRAPRPRPRRRSRRTARRRRAAVRRAASATRSFGHALDGQRPVRQQAGRRLRRRALVGVAEHGERARARGVDQPYGRLA